MERWGADSRTSAMTNCDDVAKCCLPILRSGELILLGLTAVMSAALVSWTLWFCHYGLDITDEGSYLQWMSDPFIYAASVTQYGYIYHPLYLLVQGDIAMLRQANVLITYGLGWWLSYAIIKTTSPTTGNDSWRAVIISSGLGTASLLGLIIGGSWMPTPSYNTLAMQSLLVTAIGLCLAQIGYSRSSLAGWGLIALGGLLAFMAKPTTAAALAVCVLLYLLLSGKARTRLFLYSVLLCGLLLLFSSVLIDGSVFRFVERLTRGIHLVSLVGGGYTFEELWRLGILQLGRLEQRWLFIFTVGLWGWLICVGSRYVMLKILALGLAITLCAGSLFIMWQAPLMQVQLGILQDLLIWAVPAAVILYSTSRLDKSVSPLFVIPVSAYSLLATFIVLPYAYAFGTNNNYWLSMPAISVFWIAVAVAILCVTTPKQNLYMALGVIAIATQSFTILRIHKGMENPYRQIQPIFNNDYKVDIAHSGSTVFTERVYGQYLTSAMNAVQLASFQPGTPMIDLTGQSPGLLHAFGAKGLGQAWLIGGYPGSDRLVTESLAMVACRDLSRAWLLTEPGGPRSITIEVLGSFGFTSADYQAVATWTTSPGSGGYSAVRTQIAWKPSREPSSLEQRCISYRTGTASSVYPFTESP